jgi:spore germination protein GerM
MRTLGMLSGILLATLPFGLSGCLETEAPPTVVSPSPTATETPMVGTSPTGIEPTPSASPSPTVAANATTAEVYWLAAATDKISLAPAKVALETPTKTDEAQLAAAVERLLQGPANNDVSSAIPTETKLIALKIQTDGVHVDLSKPFISGGGSTSMQGRLGQVIYTASSLKTTAPVWISVDGEPLKVLGGEGLEISQPMTRAEFDKNFPL